MEIIILPTAQDVGREAAGKFADVLRRTPAAVLGLATGSSPRATYEALASMVAAGTLDVSHASGFALDEYVGIALGHPESYASVIDREVVVPLGMDPSKVRVPDGRAADIAAACADYEAAISAAGGIDIQILGIGSNGHIGFNEPTSSFASRTRIKTLARQTLLDNARFFANPNDVPTHCLTQGLGTIMDARQLVLVAQGAGKAAAIAAMVEGPVRAFVPGSILQHHHNVSIIIDEEAASELTLTDYYRYTYNNKPAA
ncbi:MAG: Glucosamine-6-phosphate deaminase [Glaciihabitans sp.]|nr:Glucosamine-6-phosphate deaminase [Glaciihabitans sp.]